MPGGVEVGQAVAQDADGGVSVIERAAVGLAVNAVREAADDGELVAPLVEVVDQAGDELAAVVGGTPRTYNAEPLAPWGREGLVAAVVEHQRRVGAGA